MVPDAQALLAQANGEREKAAEELAAAERMRLGLGDGPVAHLRDALEADVGLRIFTLDLPSRVAGLFAYSEDLGGCVQEPLGPLGRPPPLSFSLLERNGERSVPVPEPNLKSIASLLAKCMMDSMLSSTD